MSLLPAPLHHVRMLASPAAADNLVRLKTARHGVLSCDSVGESFRTKQTFAHKCFRGGGAVGE